MGNSVLRVVHNSTGRCLCLLGSFEMSVAIEALFTSALGLQAPWSVQKVALDTSRRRIDFDLVCNANRLPCPHCAAIDQSVQTGFAGSGGTWTSSSLRLGCTLKCPALLVAHVARPARSMCLGRAKAVASPRCLKPLPCRCAKSCRCARPQRCSGARTNNCGGAFRTMSARRGLWTTCPR